MPVLIVPRGLSDQYYEFLAIATRVNGEKLLIDRRLAVRRTKRQSATDDRRMPGDRRGPVPASWVEDDLIVVN
jgi:hypothetical protein